MKRLEHWGITLPLILICENNQEARLAKSKHIPFIIRPEGWTDENILRSFLWKYVKDHYGSYGAKAPETVMIHVEAGRRKDTQEAESVDQWIENLQYGQTTDGDGYRISEGEGEVTFNPSEYDMYYMVEAEKAYCFDGRIDATIEALQDLHILPEYVSDVATAIKTELVNLHWCDGYSRKLDAYLGEYSGGDKARNLIILDVSGSIPGDISLALTNLIDTLRNRCEADLIIHSSDVLWYPIEEPLDRNRIRRTVGHGNETQLYAQCLRDNVVGKHWGNIIVFGDWDAPDTDVVLNVLGDLSSTRIDNLIAYRIKMLQYPPWLTYSYRAMLRPCCCASGTTPDAFDRKEWEKRFGAVIPGYALWILAVNDKIPITAKDI